MRLEGADELCHNLWHNLENLMNWGFCNKLLQIYHDAGKPIGVSEYDLTRALPEDLRSSLPTVEEIEAELTRRTGGGP